jgi:hypothetical protein
MRLYHLGEFDSWIMENYLPKAMDFYVPNSMEFIIPFTICLLLYIRRDIQIILMVVILNLKGKTREKVVKQNCIY